MNNFLPSQLSDYSMRNMTFGQSQHAALLTIILWGHQNLLVLSAHLELIRKAASSSLQGAKVPNVARRVHEARFFFFF